MKLAILYADVSFENSAAYAWARAQEMAIFCQSELLSEDMADRFDWQLQISAEDWKWWYRSTRKGARPWTRVPYVFQLAPLFQGNEWKKRVSLFRKLFFSAKSEERKNIRVLDMTGGFAKDALLMTSVASSVFSYEENPLVYAWTLHSLEQIKKLSNSTIQEMRERLNFLCGNSMELEKQAHFDVIYLDPMFPARKKKALPTFELQILRELVGTGQVDTILKMLDWARARATRVVLKQPSYSQIDLPAPRFEMKGEAVRFAIYC